jgi:hypothetical protein
MMMHISAAKASVKSGTNTDILIFVGFAHVIDPMYQNNNAGQRRLYTALLYQCLPGCDWTTNITF